MKMKTLFSGLPLLLASIAAYGTTEKSDLCAEQFPPATRILKLGMSAAFSGPSQHLGKAMYSGIRQRLDEENCKPFWRNQKITFALIARDDGYQPDVAAATTRELIQQENVLAFIGNVGTPTAEQSWQIANEAGVVFYGAYTGAAVLRQQPPAPFVINYRASYHQEMSLIINDIINKGIAVNKIGLFLQDDAFGKSGLQSAQSVLQQICQDCNQNLLTMYYERNSLDIEQALRAYVDAKSKPQAIIMVGASEPCAEFIRFAQRLAPATRFYSLSFAGKSRLAELLPGLGERVLVAQVVPADAEQQTQLANEVAQEGYLATASLMDAMRTIRGPITSKSLRDSLLELEQTLAPTNPHPQPVDHQLMDLVWLAAITPDTPSAQATNP